jgi:hypothetical protein
MSFVDGDRRHSDEGGKSRKLAIRAGEQFPSTHPSAVIPIVVVRAGSRAEEKFAEFFGATIRNANTRMAYLRSVNKFFVWVESKRLTLDRRDDRLSLDEVERIPI